MDVSVLSMQPEKISAEEFDEQLILGQITIQALQAAGAEVPVLQLGLPDEFVEHGDPAKILSGLGLDAAGIEQSILKRFAARPSLVRPAVNS